LKIKVIESRCPQNHPCPSARICPANALEQVGFKAPAVNYDKCIGCAKCVSFCPKNAIIMER